MKRIFATMLAIMVSAAFLAGPKMALADTAKAEDEKYHKATDAAVLAGLDYLAKSQLPDGTFPGMAKCNAITALCVMSFLAHGYNPGLEPHGETINRGIDAVLDSQQPDGTLIGSGGGSMYSHNIATLMLSEVSGMVDPDRQKRIDEVLPKALQVILAAQKVPKSENQKGGWRYEPTSGDSDMSHSGWATMALRSARNNGTPVPKEAIDDAVKYIKGCMVADFGYGYQPGGAAGLARSGAALLCLELSGQHRTEDNLKTGQLIMSRFGQWNGELVYYGMYYCAQGMFQLGETEWQEFAPKLYEEILKFQTPDGSWQNVPGAVYEDGPGPCYRSALAVLALSVSYRQLPIYQR